MDASFLTSSTEAEHLGRQKYHAVFLDMRTPPPDGGELARQVRASLVNASTVIVMITGEVPFTHGPASAPNFFTPPTPCTPAPV